MVLTWVAGGGMMVVAEQERCKDGVVVAVDVLTTM